MAVSKTDAAGRKLVVVWRFGLLVSTGAADPVIQIVDREAEDASIIQILPKALGGEEKGPTRMVVFS